MKNKSYDYIFGNGKFNTWFNIIVSIISCSAISFCLTELLFSFDFKVSFQKALIFTILFVIFLLLFYLYKNQKKIAKISARNRNVDWLQVKIAEIKKDKKKLERKK